MKLQIFRLVKVFSLLICLIGCSKDWLDEKPIKTQKVPSTLRDYQALLNYMEIMNANLPALGEVASDDHFVSESVWAASTSSNGKNAYTWSQSVSYATFYPWPTTYTRLYYSNFVLDGLTKITPFSDAEEAELNYIRAQALFNKAETYYWLAQQYAQPYDISTASTDQGIVLQDGSDFTKSIRRVSVKETYDLIVAYLKEAALFLPANPKIASQAGVAATFGLLARTYLTMQNYDSALLYADRCLQINKSLLDFSKLSTTANFIGQFNAEVIFHDQLYTAELGTFITTGCLIDPKFYNSYDNDDLRKSVFFKVTGSNITFKGNYNNSASNLFCGIATDELYLTRAECYARKGNTVAAIKDLNDLLRSRWKKVNGISLYKDLVISNAEEALVKVLFERRKELLLRGMRWVDLRRLNKDNRFRTTIERTISGSSYKLEPNDFRYTFPIPSDILQFSNFTQTTGWD